PQWPAGVASPAAGVAVPALCEDGAAESDTGGAEPACSGCRLHALSAPPGLAGPAALTLGTPARPADCPSRPPRQKVRQQPIRRSCGCFHPPPISHGYPAMDVWQVILNTLISEFSDLT